MSLLYNFNQLDTSKYKRFFVVGCSFTRWHWPTWANIIARQNPHLKFHSFAKAGQGNTYISILLNQLTHTHNLCETDLVGIMWSTFNRLDYYTSNEGTLEDTVKRPTDSIIKNNISNWRMHSDNIHTQLKLGTEKEGYCDRGFLLRDLAIIDSATTVMEHAPYTAFQMYSVEPEQQNNYDLTFNNINRDNDDVLEVYKHLSDKMITNSSLFNAMGNKFTEPTVTWTPCWEPENSSKTETDYHPSSSINCQFLQSNGYAVTSDTLQHCAEIDAKIQQTTWSMHLQDDKLYPYKVDVDEHWPM